tara:strand:- start:19459 stop:19596 length:138 start_codon:yes stop_codon:yes gene_type:complete
MRLSNTLEEEGLSFDFFGIYAQGVPCGLLKYQAHNGNLPLMAVMV